VDERRVLVIFNSMSWTFVDRETLHHQVLKDTKSRLQAKKEALATVFTTSVDKAIAKGNTSTRLVLASSLLCDGVDCQFADDKSHCLVCSCPQSWTFMRKWYAFHAKCMTQRFNKHVAFTSCSYPQGRKSGSLVKGRYTRGLFEIKWDAYHLKQVKDMDPEDINLGPLPRSRPTHPSPLVPDTKPSRMCTIM